MKQYFKYFFGVLGTTLLGQPSTLLAEPIPQELAPPPTSNDSFLGKLGGVFPASERSTREGSNKTTSGVLSIVQKDHKVIEGKISTLGDGIVVKREGCELGSPAVSVIATVKSDVFCEISSNYFVFGGFDDTGNYYYNEEIGSFVKDKNITLYWPEVQHIPIDCPDKKIFVRCDDAVLEDTETIELTLSNPTGGALIGQGNAILSIIDNDGSTIGLSQSHYVKGRDFTTITVERKNCVSGHIPTVSAEIFENSSSYTGSPCYLANSLQGSAIWKENECGTKDIHVISSSCPYSHVSATGVTLHPNFSWLNFEPTIVLSMPEDFAILTFRTGDAYDSVLVAVTETYLDVNLAVRYGKPDHRSQHFDLWIVMQPANAPDDQRFYVTSSSYLADLFSSEPQPFKTNLAKIDNAYPVFHFPVTSDMVGEYNLYAVLAQPGKNPFLDESARQSRLATTTVILLQAE